MVNVVPEERMGAGLTVSEVTLGLSVEIKNVVCSNILSYMEKIF